MSQDSAAPAARQVVPVIQTMNDAYATVFRSLGFLVKAAILPFLLSLAIIELWDFIDEDTFLFFVMTIVDFVPYTLFAVSWHRLTLLGPDRGAPATFPSWQRRHWRFLGYIAGMIALFYLIELSLYYLIIAPPPTVLSFIDVPVEGVAKVIYLSVIVLIVVIYFASLYALARVSFVFPAAAVDEDYGLANAWAHTRGQVLRLLATLFLTALPVLVAVLVVSLVVTLITALVVSGSADFLSAIADDPLDMFNTAINFAIEYPVNIVVNYVFTALTVSVLSIAFRFRADWAPAPEARP